MFDRNFVFHTLLGSVYLGFKQIQKEPSRFDIQALRTDCAAKLKVFLTRNYKITKQSKGARHVDRPDSGDERVKIG